MINSCACVLLWMSLAPCRHAPTSHCSHLWCNSIFPAGQHWVSSPSPLGFNPEDSIWSPFLAPSFCHLSCTTQSVTRPLFSCAFLLLEYKFHEVRGGIYAHCSLPPPCPLTLYWVKEKYANIHWVNIVTILHIYKTSQNYSCLLFCKRHFRWGYITLKILALKSFPDVKEYTIHKCTPLKQIHFDKRSDYSPRGNNMQTIINIR